MEEGKEISTTGNSGELASSSGSETPQQSKCCVENGRNVKTVVCQRCASIVLKPLSAVYAHKQIFLPSMRKKADQDQGVSAAAVDDGQMLAEHWLVADMYTFENIGFSNTVGSTKYLICADCEIGPIGWHDIGVTNKFYISVDRVDQVE